MDTDNMQTIHQPSAGHAGATQQKHDDAINDDVSSACDSETFDSLAQELMQAEIAEENDDVADDVPDELQQVTDVLFANQQQHDVNDGLTIDSLLRMTPIFQGRDTVKVATRHLLLTKLKSQQTARRFFPSHMPSAFERLVDNDWFDFETYAVLYVCQALSRCDDPYDLSALIDKHKVDRHLKEISDCPEWKKVGFALYTTLFNELVKDSETGVTFNAYTRSNNKKYWALQLYDKLRDSKWQHQVIQPIIQGDVTCEQCNRDMNILFVKLHLLDPTLIMPAYHLLQKVIPNLNLELATTNYLGGPLDCCLIKPDVETLIYKPLFPQNFSKLSLSAVEVYYGVDVLEFLAMEVKVLELLTEVVPNNRRTLTVFDRCCIM